MNTICLLRVWLSMLGGIGLFAGWVSVKADDVKLGPPSVEKISDLQSYYYAVRSYVPAIRVEPWDEAMVIVMDTPEDAALAHFATMLAGNYNRWFEIWDRPSQVIIQDQNIDQRENAMDWERRWQAGFMEHEEFELTRRVDTGEDAIIEFVATDIDGNAEKLILDVPLTRDEQGKWRATQTLASDPVFLYWRMPGYTWETMAREPPNLP